MPVFIIPPFFEFRINIDGGIIIRLILFIISSLFVYLSQWQLYSGLTRDDVRLVFALVCDFSLDIMVEVSGGKLLSQKSQAPVPLLSFIQAFAVVERSHGGFII